MTSLATPKKTLQRAFYDEFQKLTEKDLYEEVPHTSLTSEQQKTIVKTRWVVSDRPGTSGEDILKAHFVAKGYSQYVTSDTFAATPASKSLRAMLMLSIISGWNVTSCDISSAFVNTLLPEGSDIWVEPLAEVYCHNSDFIWRLQKAMYGLKNEPTCLAEAPHICVGEHRAPTIPCRPVFVHICRHRLARLCGRFAHHWGICSNIRVSEVA